MDKSPISCIFTNPRTNLSATCALVGVNNVLPSNRNSILDKFSLHTSMQIQRQNRFPPGTSSNHLSYNEQTRAGKIHRPTHRRTAQRKRKPNALSRNYESRHKNPSETSFHREYEKITTDVKAPGVSNISIRSRTKLFPALPPAGDRREPEQIISSTLFITFTPGARRKTPAICYSCRVDFSPNLEIQSAMLPSDNRPGYKRKAPLIDTSREEDRCAIYN